MKVVTTQYGNTKEILKFPDHYVGVVVMVSATGIAANADGRKIVPAGSIVGYSETGGEVETVATVNDETAKGVLLRDVDVTHGDASGTMIIHGFINTAHLPAAPSEDAKSVLSMVQFL